MYDSLKLPWSSSPSSAEEAYRNAGFVKTKGTIYLLPPEDSVLRTTFNAPPRPKSRMSSGANALCKHVERGGASSEKGIAHPFWSLPTGSNDNKSSIAAAILEQMLATAVWKNVMLLHPGVAVYEIRNDKGYGMRWTLQVARDALVDVADIATERTITHDTDQISDQNIDARQMQEGWCIQAVTFRGFVEPIEGIAIDGTRTDD